MIKSPYLRKSDSQEKVSWSTTFVETIFTLLLTPLNYFLADVVSVGTFDILDYFERAPFLVRSDCPKASLKMNFMNYIWMYF